MTPVDRKLWVLWLVLAGCLAIAAAPAERAHAAEDVALTVIVHPSKAEVRMSASLLKQIFTRQLLFWPDGTPIVPINFPPGDPLRVVFDRVVLGMSPDRAGEYWIDQMVRARAQPPRKLASAGLALRVVTQLKGAIAYVPASIVTADVHAAAQIADGKLVVR